VRKYLSCFSVPRMWQRCREVSLQLVVGIFWVLKVVFIEDFGSRIWKEKGNI